MTPDEWQKIEEAFEHAVALEDNERAAYLEQLESADPELSATIRRMLVEDADSGDSLLEPVAEAAEEMARTARDTWVGKTFGHYQTTERIAAGGMSAVYLGKRIDDQYDQDVAIKIVAGSFRSEELNTRFRTERQILATLRHPNIGQLYDGGTTDDGTPYLVMEYIDGLPIDRYCDEHKLSIEERLALFGKVCSAVDHAHRHLIVHRDIKPSNILVDAEGTPKLLDFGIAKPLEHADFSKTVAMTRADNRAMTPEFASPEQVRGEPITTATDVYSLGVLLYKILSGRMPYLTQGSNVAAVVQAICDTEPSKPSTAVTLSGEGDEDSSRIVATRRTSVGKLQKLLAGDLDNIVMMALQKEPERRYRTVNAMMQDIHRYLADEPVSARQDSVIYRAGKFVRRNRLGVAVTVLFVASIAGMTAWTMARIAEERDVAEAQATKAEQVVDFMSDAFRSSSPFHARGEDISVRDVLARGAENIDTTLADQPEIQAELLLRLGTIHQDLGQYEEAAELAERSLEVRQSFYGDDSSELVPALLGLSAARLESGEDAEALSLTNQALSLVSANGSEDPDLLTQIYRLRANIHDDQGNYDLSVEANRRALASLEAAGASRTREYALLQNNLASSLLAQQELDEALRTANESLELKLALTGRRHPDVAVSLSNLGHIHRAMGDLANSETSFRESLEIREAVFGTEHPDYAIGQYYLAEVLSSRQRWNEVEALLEAAIPVLETTYGPGHRWTASSRGMLAEVYSETGRTEESLALAKGWLDYSLGRANGRSWETAIAYAEYADALLEAGRDNEAIESYRNGISIFSELNGGLATAYTEAKLGRALLMTGETAQAGQLINDALEFCRNEAPPQHSIVARVLVASAEVDVVEGRFDEANAKASEALEIIDLNGQNEGGWYWLARIALAGVMAGNGRKDDARAELTAIVNGLERENGTRSRAETRARRLLDSIPPV